MLSETNRDFYHSVVHSLALSVNFQAEKVEKAAHIVNSESALADELSLELFEVYDALQAIEKSLHANAASLRILERKLRKP